MSVVGGFFEADALDFEELFLVCGVGAGEFGFLSGQYNRLTYRSVSGVFTGKAPGWGGALMRREATGYGAVFFLEEMLRVRGEQLDGRKCVVSGSAPAETTKSYSSSPSPVP